MECLGQLGLCQEVPAQRGGLDGRDGHDHGQSRRRQSGGELVPAGLREHVLDGPDQDAGHGFTGLALLDDAGCAVDPAGQVGEENLVLAGEVVEERLGGHARGGGDLGDRGLVVALLGKQPDGRADQRLPGLLALALPQPHLVGHAADLHRNYVTLNVRLYPM